MVVQDVTFLNYYGAITMGALPQAMPVGVNTNAAGDYRFECARGNQPPNSNVRVSGVVTHGVNGAYPGNIVGGKQKYAMVCISNGTAKTAVIENCTVNDADFAYNTEEMASTTTHFVSCTAVNCECGNRLLCLLDPCGWPLTLGRCCGQRRSTRSSCNPACSRR